MFLIDDQNPSSIAAFGGDTYTPNLDRMAGGRNEIHSRLRQQLGLYSISVQLPNRPVCWKLA